ncbi:testis-specific protein TEX28 [Lutra lutra]|uniref:testis-specific protein TEX28 n=1 Tax=Lutra lutra TaxID=9657 RepID=UPI001FD110C0|nr:testis-specific protein TEX28 [Lutra lutra]XP_047570782.1 testis-specific protein TEX28 [Lutra lutra]XP_047570783.1 testis-specific protein TEX28 [Lutra lutra]XP_047570784.1 testis-specific protein TEX28 [Lutra lutra]
MVLKVEDSKSSSATVPSNIASNIPSCRSLSSAEDGPSGHCSLPAGELARNLQDSVRHRILYLSEQLRVEKASRDENTMGYLKLVSKADRHQAPHIRQAFERVNQRASATIAQIERRLRHCYQQLQQLQEGCRPGGFALKAKSSPDECKRPSEKTPPSEPPKPGSADSLSTKLSGVVRHVALESHFPALRPGKPSEPKGVAQRRNLLLQKMKEDLKAARELHVSLQVSYQSLKEKHGTDLRASLVSLREEKCRQALLEEQADEHLQGRLDEIYRLRQSLASAEEKMAYLSYKRAKEIWEVMETFKNRISKLETLQRAAQEEMVENFRTRPQKFVSRCTSLLLTLAALFLVFISTVCACPLPLVTSRLRTCTTLVLISLGALAWQKRHVLPAADWQAWVPSRWRLSSKDSRPLSDGT